MRCYTKVSDVRPTHDQISPQNTPVAMFPADHRVVCNCSASGGKMKPEDCDGLTIYEGDNTEIARFTGKQFRAQRSADGGFVVFRMPRKTEDRALGHSQSLRRLNQKNEEFWRQKEGGGQ